MVDHKITLIRRRETEIATWLGVALYVGVAFYALIEWFPG